MDNQSIMSHGFDEKENYDQTPNFHLVDAGRTDGLKNTSLSVLNSKRAHKTQIQKQFQQFNHQQRQSFRPPAHSQQQSQHHQQQQHHHQSFQQGPYQQQYSPHPQYFNSMQPPSMRQPPGARSMQSLNSMASSNYSQSHVPQMLPQGEWASGRISPAKSPSLRLNSISSNSQFQPPQQDYKTTSPVLSQSEWEKPFHEEKLRELEEENERLTEENEDLKRNSAARSRVIGAENDKLQEQLDAVSLELHKLKLEHNSAKETHKIEVKKLKEKNCKLENELENMTNMASKSTETTPNGSPKTISKDYEGGNASSVQTLPESSKTLQQAQSNIENNELIQDLIDAIKSLKADNNILVSRTEDLSNQLTKDKKLIKKLVNSSRHQTKIRKGFNVLESVDTFI